MNHYYIIVWRDNNGLPFANGQPWMAASLPESDYQKVLVKLDSIRKALAENNIDWMEYRIAEVKIIE